MPRTTYRVVLGVMTLWFVGLGTHPWSGAQTARRPAEPPIAALLPAEQAWAVTLPALPSAGGALDDARVYIPLGMRGDAPDGEPTTTGPGQTIALDRETGESAWARDVGSAWPPAVGNGVVFVAAGDGIHALDAATGELRWRAPLTAPAIAAPTVADARLIVPIAPDQLLALRVEDGAIAWQQSLGSESGPASMTVDGDAIYLSLAGSRVVRVAAVDGRLVWARTLSGRLGTPGVARDRVLVGSTDNVLFALDPRDGEIEWRYPTGGDVVGAAAWADSIFFVSLDNVVRALNRGNGNQRWKKPLSTRAPAAPRAFDGLVVVHGLSPALATFAARTGAPIAVYDAPATLVGPALIDEHLKPFRVAIVAITGDGRAIGLRPTQMMFREPAPVPMTVLPGRPLTRDSQVP